MAEKDELTNALEKLGIPREVWEFIIRTAPGRQIAPGYKQVQGELVVRQNW